MASSGPYQISHKNGLKDFKMIVTDEDLFDTKNDIVEMTRGELQYEKAEHRWLMLFLGFIAGVTTCFLAGVLAG